MSPLPFLGVSSLMNCRAFGRGFFLVWTLPSLPFTGRVIAERSGGDVRSCRAVDRLTQCNAPNSPTRPTHASATLPVEGRDFQRAVRSVAARAAKRRFRSDCRIAKPAVSSSSVSSK